VSTIVSKPESKKILTEILPLEKLLFKRTLTVPEYQRPYKWSEKNVNQLIDDILLRENNAAYRIGTIVIHNKSRKFNIVDGQQRIFTLSLIAGELLKLDPQKSLIKLSASDLCIAKAMVTNPISLGNLRRNHLLIKSRVKEFKKADILFFFKKCEFVYIELKSISEAFQFFDSQNTRGKDLAPHDLLKAFHLREMTRETGAEKLRCVDAWEEVSESLNNIFANYLFRIRMWTKGKLAIAFTKDDIGIFKGINPSLEQTFNFQKIYRIGDNYVAKYNKENSAEGSDSQMEFPFQIDQVIINGKRFFEYVHHYSKYIQAMEKAYSRTAKQRDESILVNLQKEGMAEKILMKLRTYKGGGRRGDLYIRNVFDCCTIYYLDKFGNFRLDDAVVKFFLWSFALRLENQAVQAMTAQNLASSSAGFFRMIRESVAPKEILSHSVKPANYIGSTDAVQHIGGLVTIFRELNSIKS
jgi:hypothetical protein